MSWSVSVPKTPAAKIADAVEAARIDDTYNKPELVEQWGQQLAAAKRAVLTILKGDGFGEGGDYTVSMTGHAAHNGLAEETGYTSSEFVQVNVFRQPPQPSGDK